MVTLAIDTSTKRASVAISSKDHADPIEVQSQSELSHYEELPGLVDKVFALAGVTVDALEAIVIGQGPGSFTGLRIGYGFVVGLALGKGVAVTEVSSLTAIAAGAWANGLRLNPDQQRITAILDARRDEFFVQSFRCSASGPIFTEADAAVIVPARLLSKLYPQSLFVGEVGEIIVSGLVAPAKLATGLLLASKDVLNIEHGSGAHELSLLRPNYLRAVAARTIAERAGLRP